MTDKKTKTIKPEVPTHDDDAFVINELKMKLNELQTQLDEVNAKSVEYFDGWQRERADFVNYKKRIERDQVFQQQNMIINITKKYLPVLDDLDRAIKVKPTHGEGARWAEGFDLIYRKLASALESEGIKEMTLSSGDPFDPTFQEALTHEDSPAHESGQIIEVIQKGYLIGERVVRPALVRVAR